MDLLSTGNGFKHHDPHWILSRNSRETPHFIVDSADFDREASTCESELCGIHRENSSTVVDALESLNATISRLRNVIRDREKETNVGILRARVRKRRSESCDSIFSSSDEVHRSIEEATTNSEFDDAQSFSSESAIDEKGVEDSRICHIATGKAPSSGKLLVGNMQPFFASRFSGNWRDPSGPRMGYALSPM